MKYSAVRIYVCEVNSLNAVFESGTLAAGNNW